MPQYGVLVYLPAPADPEQLSPEYLEAIARYPDEAKKLGAKVLGGSYFPEQRGFAFEASSEAVSIRGDDVSDGPFVESALDAASFYVLSAPSMDVALSAAAAHPATREGGVEVRQLYAPRR